MAWPGSVASAHLMDPDPGLPHRHWPVAGVDDGAGDQLAACDVDRERGDNLPIGGASLHELLTDTLNRAITQVMTGEDENAYDSIDRSLDYMQVALSSIDQVGGSRIGLAGIGIVGPAIKSSNHTRIVVPVRAKRVIYYSVNKHKKPTEGIRYVTEKYRRH